MADIFKFKNSVFALDELNDFRLIAVGEYPEGPEIECSVINDWLGNDLEFDIPKEIPEDEQEPSLYYGTLEIIFSRHDYGPGGAEIEMDVSISDIVKFYPNEK